MYISTHQALVDFCQRAREFDAIAVDTEFLRERTFHPRLCLVQIATPAESVAVDPLVIDDLSPLAELMADESVTKVFHACSQDMEVMLHTVGALPRPIFDTQVAAAFLGERQQISYGALVQTFCGVSLPKTESLTDWSRRPLTDKQIEYAIDDVKYLIVAYTEMMSRLRELGRVDWVLDELRPLAMSRTTAPTATKRSARSSASTRAAAISWALRASLPPGVRTALSGATSRASGLCPTIRCWRSSSAIPCVLRSSVASAAPTSWGSATWTARSWPSSAERAVRTIACRSWCADIVRFRRSWRA